MSYPYTLPASEPGGLYASGDLLQRIRAALETHPDGLSEHAMIKEVGQAPAGPLPAGALSDSLVLYQVHFSLFNALYRLRDEYRADGRFELRISPLRICLEDYESGEDGIAPDDALRRFYLELENFDITREDVESLLRYARSLLVNPDRRLRALQTLELDEEAGLQQIRRRYKELAMRHHPDRGGNEELFKEIVEAVETLTGGRNC